LSLQLAAQTPLTVSYQCTPQDVETLGLNCSPEEPCPVFLELSAAEAAGNRLFVTGNLHTRDVTLSSILLTSDDGGATWTEPMARLRNASLEQIEFLDQLTGWISGGMIDPLARDPFLLITRDGGKTWRQKMLFEDTKYGTIAQFHFNSLNVGELILDASRGKATRQELYGTMTGGDNWEIKQTSNVPLRIKDARPANSSGLRLRANSAAGTYHLEKGGGRNWVGLATFKIRLADCR
jgi:photosystem II stability/assembly factor-like uncharacterized protein